MNDLEDIHATKASELINNFQDRSRDTMQALAQAITSAFDSLNTIHAEFITDLGALSITTAAQIGSRLDTTRQMQEDLMHHFLGTMPMKEPRITIVPRKSDLPNVLDAPQLTDETLRAAAE